MLTQLRKRRVDSPNPLANARVGLAVSSSSDNYIYKELVLVDTVINVKSSSPAYKVFRQPLHQLAIKPSFLRQHLP